ncbi:MAG: glycosyltransferase family 2 protein [Coriobacteriales bacterium]
MAAFVNTFNLFLFFIFSLCYTYQAVYAVIVLVKDHRKKHVELPDGKLHKYAVMISGRNEEKVIGELVKSLKEQDYPEELLDIYVIADNCTDNTAQVARDAGAEVFVRNDKLVVGKSHALDFALNKIRILHGDESGRTDYDGYFVFDADNVVDPNFVRAMNRGFNRGYQVLTCYRNSKNYDSNWVSAGSALWFLREAKFLSNARYMMGTSCAISGTGFLIDADILESNNGWIHHLLTEDIEFSTDCISNGIRIGYCGDAYVYDEQPTTMKDSWNQRMRWAKGFYQVLLKYGNNLFKGIFKRRRGRFACYDMYMTIAPAMLLTIAGFLVNLVFCLTGIVQLATIATSVQNVALQSVNDSGLSTAIPADANWLTQVIALMTGSLFQGDALSTFNTSNVQIILSYSEARATIVTSVLSLGSCFLSFAVVMLVFGILTTITEWDHIHASSFDKIKYIFTFPIFMLTYVPIALIAVFKKVKWTPITHDVVRSTADVVNNSH